MDEAGWPGNVNHNILWFMVLLLVLRRGETGCTPVTPLHYLGETGLFDPLHTRYMPLHGEPPDIGETPHRLSRGETARTSVTPLHPLITNDLQLPSPLHCNAPSRYNLRRSMWAV